MDGVAMKSPFGPIIAGIFMVDLETKVKGIACVLEKIMFDDL